MLYVRYLLPGNALAGVAATEDALPPATPNSVTKALPEWADVPPAPYVWNPALANFAIPQTPVKLSRLDFQWRYTLAEQIAIERAMEEHDDPDVRATLRILDKSLMKVTEESGVKVEDLRTASGVQYHAALGLIAPARVVELLGYDPLA